MQAVEQLSFVLVDTFDVDVKYGGRVHFNSVVFLQNLSQSQFILLFHLHHGPLESRILGKWFEFLQLFQMDYPVFTNLFGNQIAQTRVA